MQRSIITLTLGGVLLTGAACGAKNEPTAAPTTAAPTSASPSPSAAPSPSDYTADTKRVCGQIEKMLESRMEAFGQQLGKMVAYREAGNTAQAQKAKTAAQKELATTATAIRQYTGAAQDPELWDAGKESAKNVEATAADAEFFRKFRNPRDLDALKAEVVTWLVPLAEFCA
jgi:uncharacterized protein (DUF305 family)